MKFTLMTLKNSASASHKTLCDYIIGTSGLILFIIINVMYYANHTKHIVLESFFEKSGVFN